MVYNNVTNALRAWCDTMTTQYAEKYEREGNSQWALCSRVTGEMSYKLGTLIDKESPHFGAYRQAVPELLAMRIDFVKFAERTKVEDFYIEKAERAFCAFLDSLTPDCPSPDVPYCRRIWGEEADGIAQRFYEVWGYDTDYWFPLNGMSMEDKLFLAPKYLEPHRAEIDRALGLPEQRIYEYGEPWYDCIHCAEVDATEDYDCCEVAYCPKDFSWIMYFSHENTVAFAGTIVPRIKEILHDEREHWNVFEWEN